MIAMSNAKSTDPHERRWPRLSAAEKEAVLAEFKKFLDENPHLQGNPAKKLSATRRGGAS